MCGIAGIVDLRPGSDGLEGPIRRMTECLAHRGPDDAGYHVAPGVALGHRRLSIIDVQGGRQPIYSDDRSKLIVFNGEIYNFASLRRTLERAGHRFQTSTDTEVVLRAYEAYGAGCVSRLRGMFAFAIWDDVRRRLFVARDRVGIKPLYYAWDGRRFLFGSELKSLLEAPDVTRELDPLALDDYLTYLYIPAPKTVYRSVRKLRPGYTLTVSAEGLEEVGYWDLSFEPGDWRDEHECAEALLAKIREAVGCHLVSDVPLGAFLSGGVDSSAIVAIMTELTGSPVTTASIGFAEPGWNELPYARLMARRCGAAARELTVAADAAAVMDELAWHFDEPFADSSMVPTYYVCRAARAHVTVCLSGDGGDENFAGYRRYRFDLLENRIRGAVPAAVRGPLFGALGAIYPKADWLPRPLRAKTLLSNLSASPERGYFQTMAWFTPEMKRAAYGPWLKRGAGGYDPFSVLEEHFARSEGWDPLSRVQYVDVKTYLPDDILTKVDRASMAHGLEVRVPLLDHEVMELAARIPARFKLRAGEGKHVFKLALKGVVPDEILYRSKMGFSVPLARWFRHELRPTFETDVLGGSGLVGSLLDLGAVRDWWEQHQRGTRDYAYHLWALLVLEAWGRRFLAGDEWTGLRA